VRTIAIMMMVGYHTLYLLEYFGIRYTGVPGPYRGFWWWIPIVIVSLFTLTAGISLPITYSRSPKTPSFILRGLKILGLGMGITVITWVINPYGYVRFGILHFFGLAFVLATFFLRFHYVNLIAGAALMAAGIYQIQTWNLPSPPWLLWLIPHRFATMDYWPLLPWFGVFLVGMFVGQTFYPQGKRIFVIPDLNNPAVSALTLLGRHPLVIYLAQWPVLIGILLVLFPGNVLPHFPRLPF